MCSPVAADCEEQRAARSCSVITLGPSLEGATYTVEAVNGSGTRCESRLWRHEGYGVLRTLWHTQLRMETDANA